MVERDRFVPASAGVFFLVDFDSIMPSTGPDGDPLSAKARLDAAVASMLQEGIFLVRCLMYELGCTLTHTP